MELRINVLAFQVFSTCLMANETMLAWLDGAGCRENTQSTSTLMQVISRVVLFSQMRIFVGYNFH